MTRAGAERLPAPPCHETTDIVMLTHNRLDHLVQTVDALEERTTAPFRITIVDNASGPEVRNWLEANRARFHQLILLDGEPLSGQQRTRTADRHRRHDRARSSSRRTRTSSSPT